jgi:RimJ/RimL family protein N-acetyltransferase
MSNIRGNKLTPVMRNGQRNNFGSINFLRYTGDQLKTRDMSKLTEIVYKNFEELTYVPNLNHDRNEIDDTLSSKDTIVILGTVNKIIISYLIARVTDVNDLTVMHIYYLYTIPTYRSNGIATFMLNLIQKYAQEMKIHMLSLTFDTYNMELTKFYFTNRFEYDKNLRSFKRYDILVKYI